MKRDRLNILFRLLIGLCIIGLIFIAVYNSFSSMTNFVVLFWGIVLLAIFLKILHYVLLVKLSVEFVDIEEIENNDENIIDKVIKQFKLGNR